MATKRKPKKPLAGAAYRKASGLVGVVVYLTAEERERVSEAARLESMSVQVFTRWGLVKASTDVLGRKEFMEKN